MVNNTRSAPMSDTNPQYLTCAQTATLMRQALKESFTKVTFNVRSSTFSMGAAINVEWTDRRAKH